MRNGKRIHDNTTVIKAWIDGYKNNKSAEEVAKELGMKRPTLAYRITSLRNLGVPLPKYQAYADIRIDELKELTLSLLEEKKK